jgi:AcrR family transcriptional regulator
MSATPEARVDRRPRPGSKAPKRRLPSGRRKADGLSSEDVAVHQRLRLYGAMIELAGARGYVATGTGELSRVASMSKRDMYKHFPTKEAYFLATYDFIVQRAVRRLGGVYAREGDWRQRLRRSFLDYAALVVEDPDAARLVLVEVLAVGPPVVGRMERTRRLFESILTAGFNEAPDGVSLPPLVAKGIVCGLERITRQRLLTDRIEELPRLADELLEWALSYRSPDLARLSEPTVPLLRARHRRQAPRDERGRILLATATLAARDGYASLTPNRIARGAGVSPETFEAECSDLERCFLDALWRLGTEALVCAAAAAQGADDRLVGVQQGITALMDRVAGDPVLRRVAFVEVSAVRATPVRSGR